MTIRELNDAGCDITAAAQAWQAQKDDLAERLTATLPADATDAQRDELLAAHKVPEAKLHRIVREAVTANVVAHLEESAKAVLFEHLKG